MYLFSHREKIKNRILGHMPGPYLKDHERVNFHFHSSRTKFYSSDANLGNCGTRIITLGSILSTFFMTVLQMLSKVGIPASTLVKIVVTGSLCFQQLHINQLLLCNGMARAATNKGETSVIF